MFLQSSLDILQEYFFCIVPHGCVMLRFEHHRRPVILLM